MNTRKVCWVCLVLLLLSTAAHAKIIFGSERNGVEGIYIMDDDGSNQTRLIEGGSLTPWSWSPDGQQILFSRIIGETFKENGVWQVIRGSVLFLMNPDGTNIRQLTENDDSYIGRASFSPDGKFIVYDRLWEENDKEKDIVEVLNIKTGKRKVILDRSVTSCDWSPDGKHILFAEPTQPGKSSTIWIMGADGHNPRELILNPGPQRDKFHIYRERPRWSPDGQQVVFVEVESKWELVPGVVNALIFKAYRYMIYDRANGNISKLSIPRDWVCYGIDWMDDGKSVVFTARAGMPMDKPRPPDFVFPHCYVYKYHLKTRKITQLTNDHGWDQIIDWISDDVLSVSPQDKKKVTWGAIKQ
ncbi:MAG: hypothetical protein OXU23_16710 [Candidatus Poribacteria bacterium]|nr:hypothetical protein [Candidatus Poribacteria bacterium]